MSTLGSVFPLEKVLAQRSPLGVVLGWPERGAMESQSVLIFSVVLLGLWGSDGVGGLQPHPQLLEFVQ